MFSGNVEEKGGGSSRRGHPKSVTVGVSPKNIHVLKYTTENKAM